MGKMKDNTNNKASRDRYSVGRTPKAYMPKGDETSDGIKRPHTSSNVNSMKRK